MSSSLFIPSGDPASLGFVPARLKCLDQRIQRYVDDGMHAGVSVLVLRDGKVADYFAAGLRDVQLQLPMERTTILRVYSMTKIVVSVAALTLMEEGAFGLREPVSKYLPEFANLQVMIGGTGANPVLVPAERPITIQHLYTHTSGLLYGTSGYPIDKLYTGANLSHASSLAEFVRRLAILPLGCQPGTHFVYGYSTDVLARLVEIVADKRLDLVLRERILDPLGMNDTDFEVTELGRLSKTYMHAPMASSEPGSGRRFEPAPLPIGEAQEGMRKYPVGGTGLFSTLDDFGRFGQMLCNGGELDGIRILGRKTVELMTINHLASLKYPYHSFRAGNGFGLGVSVRVDDDLVGTLGTKGLYGWDGVATTRLRIDPIEKLVMLCCSQHLPCDEYGMFELFQNLVYQALV